MPRICLARMPHLETNLHGCATKQEDLSNVKEGIDNLLNKDNCLMTSAREDFSTNVPTPNMLLSSSRSS